MSALPPLEPENFSAFFRAVHGHEPFPWQERLAHQVATGEWPRVLDLPTGTGKTAALDIAVFALALNAGRTKRTSPLRIVYVVDRRTIVDQAYERAKRIQRGLRNAEDDIVRRVKERLASYSVSGLPLLKALLRGGIARDDGWVRTPDQPLIAVSTVDQVGSRLLFRGYGVSDEMKPVHAGLLGCDVLYLLDEVHLSQPFRETLQAIHERYRTWAERPLGSPFVVVEMSATPGTTAGEAFRLDDADRRHQVLAARLQSSKPVHLVSATARTFHGEIRKNVMPMLERPGATVAVVVNRVRSARELHEQLSAAVPADTSVHLLTGRMRPFDRDRLEGGLLTRIRAGRTRSQDDQPIVVVATQSIEAGADFDFDGLVTECASLDALRQRFGRLDRLGELAGSARGVIVARTDTFADDPVYGDAIGKTWTWLQERAEGDRLDFGISALLVPDDADARGLLAPKAHAPILLPNHLDLWAQTGPTPAPDPDVSLWLHGPQRGVADVQIVWRADVTEGVLHAAASTEPNAAEAKEIVLGMIAAIPPASGEAMPVSFLAARRWLQRLPEPESFDVEGAAVPSEEARDKSVGTPRPAIVWQGDESRVIHASDLAPGQTIVVPAAYGGIRDGNWAPASDKPVSDVAELAAWRQGRRPVVRLHDVVVRGLLGDDVVMPEPAPADSEMLDDRATVVEWLNTQAERAEAGDARELLEWLRRDTRLRVERIPKSHREATEYLLVMGGRRRVRRSGGDGDDERAMPDSSESSFTGVEVTLAEHLTGVGELVGQFAVRVGLPSELAADLSLAGEWHDAGKADRRFQRWLHGGSEFKALVQCEPLAKSTVHLSSGRAMRVARERAGYPAGGRHELQSLMLMQSAGDLLAARATDRDLVQHLVAAHHGRCRSLAPFVPDPSPVDVTFTRNGVTYRATSAHELARLDSGVAERFWQMVRRYGWWGLAWLEALLRLADHRQSEREQSKRALHA